jgi:phage baseplate assembly protein W
MAITRADTLTVSLKQQEYFSDFLNSFAYTPVGNNLGKVTNAAALKQSLKNLILTNLGERLFQPNIGSNVTNSLFELNSPMALSTLEFNIKNTIKFNEPRVNLLQAKAKNIDEGNNVEINIIFSLINNPEPITLSFLLKRVR